MSSPDPVAAALASLKASHAAERLAHAYLLVGNPRGEGLALARGIAQLVLCRDFAPPCGKCAECERVAGRTHPDVVWLEPEKKSRIIGVEQVRTSRAQLASKSFCGGWKVAVLLGADRMNQESANAFLKTLEEPPPRTLILLVTDSPQALLPTIISRCHRLALATGDRPVQATWTGPLLDLLAAPPGAGVLERVARARRLQGLLDAERKRIEKEVDAELEPEEDEEGAAQGEGGGDEEVSNDVRAARVESKARQVRADMLHTMTLWRRDVMVLAAGGDAALLHFPDRAEDLRRLAKPGALDGCIRDVQGLTVLVRRLDRNIRPEGVAYESLLLDSAN